MRTNNNCGHLPKDLRFILKILHKMITQTGAILLLLLFTWWYTDNCDPKDTQLMVDSKYLIRRLVKTMTSVLSSDMFYRWGTVNSKFHLI